jgi:hypothetical protein
MEWVQVLTIIATMLGGIFYIHTDVREIRKDMQQQGSRIDKLYELFVEEMKVQSSRTDKLYQMFIDLLKSKNTP